MKKLIVLIVVLVFSSPAMGDGTFALSGRGAVTIATSSSILAFNEVTIGVAEIRSMSVEEIQKLAILIYLGEAVNSNELVYEFGKKLLPRFFKEGIE